MATIPAPEQVRSPRDAGLRRLWRRWVLANAWAELVGLGASGAVAALTVSRSPDSLAGVVAGAALVVAVAGVTEGGVVGWAQHRVLRTARPQLRLRRWVGATILGAVVAWGLGMLPSTLLDMSDAAGGTTPAEPGLGIQLGLAAVLGLVAGSILGAPQARVLRDHAPRAWRWIPANAVAWAAGMPLVFLVAGGVPEGWTLPAILGVVAATLLLVGAVVGAIHGWVLVRLLGHPMSAAPSTMRRSHP
jgi:hypothetical protein